MRSTKGKTWEEIYGPEYAAVKREQLRKQGRRPKSKKTRKLLSESKKRGFAEGRYVAYWKGKHLPEEMKRKMGATRRARYGTRASLNKKVRYTSKYRQWRTSIFERDAYTCQHCGINTRKARKRVYLHVHHIIEFYQLLEGLSFEQAMQDPKVWDADNAVTLCVSCHHKIPVSEYWK